MSQWPKRSIAELRANHDKTQAALGYEPGTGDVSDLFAEIDRLAAELAAARADERRKTADEIWEGIEDLYREIERDSPAGATACARVQEIARSIGSKPRPDAGEGGTNS
jgi:hypothetical protein